jgi:hypothetical protein
MTLFGPSDKKAAFQQIFTEFSPRPIHYISCNIRPSPSLARKMGFKNQCYYLQTSREFKV